VFHLGGARIVHMRADFVKGSFESFSIDSHKALPDVPVFLIHVAPEPP